MSEPLDLTAIPNLPQALFLHQLLPTLWQRNDVEALWLEGSMGRGNADLYSDVDLYVVVESARLDEWRTMAVADFFAEAYAAHSLSIFAEDFFVYHVYLRAGGIYDLHIQPTSKALPKSQRLLLGCRHAELKGALAEAVQRDEDVPLFAPQPLDPTLLPDLFVRFWINADKSRKVLYRNQDFTGYTGLYLFRQMLARLLFMEVTGNDCGDLTRPSIHGLKAAAAVLNPNHSVKVANLMGAPATNRKEMYLAQAILHDEVARVGRVLAEKYRFEYPLALEQIVMQNWQEFMEKEG